MNLINEFKEIELLGNNIGIVIDTSRTWTLHQNSSINLLGLDFGHVGYLPQRLSKSLVIDNGYRTTSNKIQNVGIMAKKRN